MAAGFVGEAEIAAGLFPFRAMRGDATVGGAGLGHEVGEFVAEGAVHFLLANEREGGIQDERTVAVGGEAGG